MSQPQFISWKPEPTFRGTWDIIITCLSTLIFCVWSAVHIDIPKNPKTRTLCPNLGWLLVGLLAPELLLYIAYKQRRTAVTLLGLSRRYLKTAKQKEEQGKDGGGVWYEAAESWFYRYSTFLTQVAGFQTLTDDPIPIPLKPTSSPAMEREHAWTLVHAFYASMGGFVFDTTDDEDPLAEPYTRAVLTPHGVAYLLKHQPDLIPDISEDNIKDRSKADRVAKFLLLIQTLWFCTSCIGRLAQHLPLSLLEVSTVAHALCTLVTYMLWWDKPLNIGEPTLMKGEHSRDVCAALLARSSSRSYGLAGLVVYSETRQAPFSAFALKHPTLAAHCARILSTIRLLKAVSVFAVGAQILTRSALILIKFTMQLFTEFTESIAFVAPHAGLQTMVRIDERLQIPVEMEDPSQSGARSEPQDKLRESISAAIVAILPAVYGVPHILAWNLDFPTSVERTFWRLSVLIVIGIGVCSGVFSIAEIVAERQWSTVLRRLEPFFIWISVIVYSSGSIYLVVESIRQLFHLPPAAFELPEWANYIPHFS